MLQVASGASTEEINELLGTSGVNLLPERDTEGKTARDLAESDEMRQCLGVYYQLTASY